MELAEARTSKQAAALFPDALQPVYAAWLDAVAAEGEATFELKKTQVSAGRARKFSWLVPLTKTTCLVLLDMFEAHEAPVWRDVITYRDDKATHQAEVRSAADIAGLAEAGWFAKAAEWGSVRGRQPGRTD